MTSPHHIVWEWREGVVTTAEAALGVPGLPFPTCAARAPGCRSPVLKVRQMCVGCLLCTCRVLEGSTCPSPPSLLTRAGWAGQVWAAGHRGQGTKAW